MIELESVPQLREPVLIAAFEGWNDAGESATAAVEHLEQTWHAAPLASLDPEEYYDFQVNRPQVGFDTEGNRFLRWPTTRMSLTQENDLGRDVVLLRGIEPNLRWRGFCSELLGVAAELGIDQIVTFGALLADVPHTRPVPVTASSSEPAASNRVLNVEQSRYEGPTGIVGVFQDAAVKAGFDAVSLWAAVPHYVGQSPCPKATVVLLRRLEDLLEMSIPLGDLPDQAEAWQHGVEELTREDSDIAEYVQRLEEASDTIELPEASGEHIAREFERYLRHRGNDT
ncbi:PAC2 family protein [Actinobacteria bacterium YIM 96077]|uniref:PAC2 family protein n=1 Tax=Phytoactinopolyspora halophila TaxID=1981511 RepID=A0A329QYV4_9ACTN|nr:PAC2 family protein [Phytoactinopolyspora halophila]AYY13324.1 PAC2 family protein [Actinobacteria bacterium YIM 96077]RAW17441.1 PAC2 family protein [Phytoactinopolyspora halophila]